MFDDPRADFVSIVTWSGKAQYKTVSGESILSLVEYLSYHGREINSTEKKANIRIGKAEAALNKANVIWKSDLPDPCKGRFF